MHTKKTPARRQRGVAMIEVLIAILILCLAALANAGLQISGLRANTSAKWRSIATAQANDMADRIRANRAGLSAFSNASGIPSDPGCTSSTSSCSATDMANHDLNEWNTANAAALPGGLGVICLDNTANPNVGKPTAPGCSGTGSTYSIKIWWKDRDDPKQPDKLQLFVTNFQP